MIMYIILKVSSYLIKTLLILKNLKWKRKRMEVVNVESQSNYVNHIHRLHYIYIISIYNLYMPFIYVFIYIINNIFSF